MKEEITLYRATDRDWDKEKNMYAGFWLCNRLLQEHFAVPGSAKILYVTISDKPMPEAHKIKRVPPAEIFSPFEGDFNLYFKGKVRRIALFTRAQVFLTEVFERINAEVLYVQIKYEE